MFCDAPRVPSEQLWNVVPPTVCDGHVAEAVLSPRFNNTMLKAAAPSIHRKRRIMGSLHQLVVSLNW
jgi:hypothetical protein